MRLPKKKIIILKIITKMEENADGACGSAGNLQLMKSSNLLIRSISTPTVPRSSMTSLVVAASLLAVAEEEEDACE